MSDVWPWRKVSEVGLPPKGKWVFVYARQPGQIDGVLYGRVHSMQGSPDGIGFSGYFDGEIEDIGYYYEPGEPQVSETGAQMQYITHWMPWPTPPQEDA